VVNAGEDIPSACVWDTATDRSWNNSSASIIDADIRHRDTRDPAARFLPNACHNQQQVSKRFIKCTCLHTQWAGG